MRILFTLIVVCYRDESMMYVDASKTLASQILTLIAGADVMITTNRPELYESITGLIIRDIKDLVVGNDFVDSFDDVFNYNNKRYAFNKLPCDYDLIIYSDCDASLHKWDGESFKYLSDFIDSKYDCFACRSDATLRNAIIEAKTIKPGGGLFGHKVFLYGHDTLDINDDILNARLPSEHILMLRPDCEKMDLFASNWRDLDLLAQCQNGRGGVHDDAYEIGISLWNSGYKKMKELSYADYQLVLGFQFNGNKS